MSGQDMRPILGKQMDRKQFLQFMGTALIAVFGFSNLMSLLRDPKTHHNGALDTDLSDSRHGFGSRKFGV